ncbi:MAG: hypothetical protein HKP44_03845 [Desulfofustis sp.]|nr:hypothetical protein [Desulfofustis sp.]
MKKTVLAALLLTTTIAGSGRAATYGDTEQAFEDCQLYLERSRELTVDESIRANSCVNFVIGAWDMGEYLSWRDVFQGKEPPFCPPEEEIGVMTPINIFVSYVADHPEKMDHRLAMVLEWSFQNAYPCTDGYYLKLAN